VIEDLKSNVDLLDELVPTFDNISLGPEPKGLTASKGDPENQTTLPGPAGHYCSKISARFPLLDTRLVERLGLASWLRHKRVRETLEAVAEIHYLDKYVCEDDTPTIQLEKKTLEPSTSFHDFGLGTGMQITSKYPASQASHQPFISSMADNENDRARLSPLPPEALLFKPFTCSVCRTLVREVKNTIQWR
jgi:hypothetical protein